MPPGLSRHQHHEGGATPTLGLAATGNVTADPTGAPRSHAQTIRQLVSEGVTAETSGVDSFCITEFHTVDRPVAAPEIALAAIAARTSRIGLGSSMTAASSDDPVRVFQRSSTLDAVSSGRAEVILGGPMTSDASALFGYSAADEGWLFEEKAQLLAKLLAGRPVTWAGRTRAPLADQPIVPNPEQGSLQAWLAVDARAEWVLRAARHGYSLMIPNEGGPSWRFVPYVQLFREALRRFHRAPLPVGVRSPGHVAASDMQAQEEFWSCYQEIEARSDLWAGALATEVEFMREIGPEGALYVGSPETVSQKISATLQTLAATRFDLVYDMRGLSDATRLDSIHLFGTEVAPRVRNLMRRLSPGPGRPRT